jgi:hypothetical protein
MCVHVNGVCYGNVCSQKFKANKFKLGQLCNQKWKRITWVVIFLMFSSLATDEAYACFRGRRDGGIFRRFAARVCCRRAVRVRTHNWSHGSSSVQRNSIQVNPLPKLEIPTVPNDSIPDVPDVPAPPVHLRGQSVSHEVSQVPL